MARIQPWTVALLAILALTAIVGVPAESTSSSSLVGVDLSAAASVESTTQWAELVDSIEAAFDGAWIEIEAESAQAPKTTSAKAPAQASSKAPAKSTAKAPAKSTSKAPAKSQPKANAPAQPKTPAERLSDAEQQAKWAAFRAANPKKKYRTAAAEQAAFQQFCNNRARIVAANDASANAINPKPFKSNGPLSDISPEKFRAKFLRTRKSTIVPTKRLANRENAAAVKRFGQPKVTAPTKQVRFAQQESEVLLESEAELDSELDAEADSETEVEVDVDAEVDAEADADADAESEVDAEAEAEADAAAELDAEAEAESESEAAWFGSSKPAPAAAPKTGAGGAAGAAGTRGGAAGTRGGAAAGTAGAAGTRGGAAGTRGGAAGDTAGAAGTRGGAAGTRGGAAGDSAGAAGTRGGAAGTRGGEAAGTAGASGTRGGAAGTRGGDAGEAAGASGTRGGAAGTDSSVIVSPDLMRVIERFMPFVGPVFLNKADTTPTHRICRAVANIWFRRYAHTSAQKLWQFGLKMFGGGAKQFLDDPMKLCVSNWHKWVEKVHPEQAYIRSAFEELRTHPSGTPFVNKHVATNDAPMDQEQCGSCWAQAAVGSYEAALKKAGFYTGPLSVQQIIDCVKTKESQGCAGGTPQDALAWLKKNPPALEKDYPYTGVAGTCRAVTSSIPRTDGWEAATRTCTKGACSDQYGYETELLFAVKSAGPFVAYVDATHWQNYAGGIYPPSKCSSHPDASNHVVQLLGYGQQDGVPYWIIKNSWGQEWGEGGYIKLAMGVNSCGIANFVGRATLSMTDQMKNSLGFSNK